MKRKICLIALALVLALSLCACGQNYQSSDDTAATEPEMAYGASASFGARRAATEEAVEAPMMDAPVESSATAAGDAENGVNIPAPMPEKIIYTANLQMETTNFDETVAAFEASIVEYGGYTMYSDVSGDTSYGADGSVRVVNRYASYTVSIPADKLASFLAETGELGNVTSSNKSAENVTTRYTDFETRKNSLLTEETRLLELLERAEDVDSLIALENRLSDVRYQIESIQSNLNDLDRRLAYSTVYLYLQEVRGYTSTASVTRSFGDRMRDAFGSGWDNFVDGLEDFAVGMAEAIIPLALLVIVMIVIIVIVRKKTKKNRAAKRAEKAAEKPADSPAESNKD